jgi:ABC-type lipoprotein release transport system permease subunit
MAALRLRFRAELRVRWRAWFVLGLLLGVAAGAVMAALAGARRTDTAYGRFLRTAGASDFTVESFGPDPQADYDALERRPEVEAAGRYTAMGLAEYTPDGGVAFPFQTIASDGRRFYAVDRLALLQGRMPHPDRADEALANQALAERRGLKVGDTVEALTATEEVLAPYMTSPDGFERLSDAVRRGEVTPDRVEFKITGVGVFPREVALDEQFRDALLVVTPRFLRSARTPEFWTTTALRLRPGTDLDAFRADIDRVTAPNQVQVNAQADTTRQVARSVVPYVSGLVFFALVAGLAGMFVIGLTLSRQAIVDGVDDPTLRALGLGGRDLTRLAAARGTVVGLIAAVVSVLVAALASPLTPIGPVRSVEVNPGIALDAPVIGIGASVVALVAVAWISGTSWLVARRGRRAAPGSASVKPARLFELLGRAGAKPAMVTGVRAAIQPTRGTPGVPVRTTLVGAAVSVAALVAVVVFGAGVDRLVTTPRLYGWSWDVAISGNSGYNSLGADEATGERPLERRLERDPGVREWAWASYGSLTVDERGVPAVGIEIARGAVYPTLLEGRPATSDDEIVVGTTTLRSIGKGVGDRVRVGAGSRTASKVIVGRAVFPALGFGDAARTALGDGVALTARALSDIIPDAFPSAALVGLVDGHERSATLAGLQQDFADPLELFVFPPQQPGEIAEYGRIRWMPVVLACLLGLLGAGALAHALVTTSRRHRRELAVLRALGFTRHQLAATIHWQASTVASVGLLVGIPVGLVVGGLAWRGFTARLGVAADPVVPVFALAMIVPGALLVANLLAAVPARVAARTRPAIALRSE